MQFLVSIHAVDSRQQGTSGHDGESSGTCSSADDQEEQVGGAGMFTVKQKANKTYNQMPFMTFPENKSTFSGAVWTGTSTPRPGSM